MTMDSEFCIHGVWRCSRARSPKAHGPLWKEEEEEEEEEKEEEEEEEAEA